MFEWIGKNIGTILIAAVLAALVALIIVKLVSDRKKGRSSCGCGCEACALHDTCHAKK